MVKSILEGAIEKMLAEPGRVRTLEARLAETMAVLDLEREARTRAETRLAEAERKLEKALYIMTPAQLYHFDKPHREPRPDYSDHPQYLAEAFRTTDSADAGLRQLQRESEDLGLYEPQSAHQHWPGQAQCEWCKGTGAIDAPTSADDPTCPNCDGEGRWAK